jgi:hypothetical protein
MPIAVTTIKTEIAGLGRDPRSPSLQLILPHVRTT